MISDDAGRLMDIDAQMTVQLDLNFSFKFFI